MLKSIALITGLGFAGFVGVGMYVASQHPIHDLTTDFDDPPQIIAGAAPGVSRKNPAGYTGADKVGGKSVADLQRARYPDIGPLFPDAEPARIFDAAQEIIEKQSGFSIIASDPATGIIEATHTSSVFKFVDDFIVRIREENGRTRIDFRSKSRVGRSDLGTNARRIRWFQGALKSTLAS